jgi:hypothetical protein
MGCREWAGSPSTTHVWFSISRRDEEDIEGNASIKMVPGSGFGNYLRKIQPKQLNAIPDTS